MLALSGGAPVRTRPFPSWPVWDHTDEEALLEVLRSGMWGVGGSKVPEFETISPLTTVRSTASRPATER